MRRCAHFPDGAAGLVPGEKKPFMSPRVRRQGFTLLEMCIVLFIIALLAAMMVPAWNSAMAEQAVRNDARELSLMVKTAMLQSTDQHRAYIIDLTPATMSLHPVGVTDSDSNPSASDNDSSEEKSAPENVRIVQQIDRANKLSLPDPDKPKAWQTVTSATWLFEPGELCPAPRVRLSRGNAWVELSFNPLTGNVENEATYFP